MFSRESNVFQLKRRVVTLLLIFNTFFKLSFASTPYVACRNPSYGAKVEFYEYPLYDKDSFKNPDFLSGGYTKNKYLGEFTPVLNVSWDSGWPATVYPYGFNGVPITNFLMVVTAYYQAPQTGHYTITLKADDFAAVYVGSHPLLNQCDFDKYNFTSNELVVSSTGLEANSKKVFMGHQVYYPIKIIYVNYMERGILSVDITKPDGTVDAGINKYLYEMPDSPARLLPTTLVTKYLTSTVSYLPGLTAPTTFSTTTSTDWLNSENGEVDIIYYVDEPMSTTAPTATTDVSVPTISSYSTLVTNIIGSSTTADVSVPITSSYTTLVTGSIGSPTTTGASVPSTSTYTTVITGTIASASPEVVFTVGVEVEVLY